jgi:Transglutaminase-like superfamily
MRAPLVALSLAQAGCAALVVLAGCAAPVPAAPPAAPVASPAAPVASPPAPAVAIAPPAPSAPLGPGVPAEAAPAPTLSAPPANPLADRPFFLAGVTLEVDPSVFAMARESESDAAFGAGVRATIVLSSGRLPDELARRSPGLSSRDGKIELGSLAYPPSRDKDAPAYAASSFVVDYREKAFAPARDAFAQTGARATPPALTRFVAEFIANKTLSRGFDFASRVAQTRSGDCTEHAVLLAALLRDAGLSARVVFGALVVLGPQAGVAVQHAWVEYRDGGRWTIADAAMEAPPPAPDAKPSSPSPRLRKAYVPMAVLRDEGPGYVAALLTAEARPFSSISLSAAKRGR